MIRATWASACLLVLGLVQVVVANPSGGSAFKSMNVEVSERSGDVTWPILPMQKRLVDANSLIEIRFSVPDHGSTVVNETVEWKNLSRLLQECETLAGDVARLNLAIVDLDDALAVTQLQGATRAVGERVEDFLVSIRPHLGDLTVTDLVIGDFPGAGDSGSAYENLGLWIKTELAALRSEAEKAVDRGKYQVLVQAFHEPIGAARNAVHVPRYDRIPAGELQPVPGLTLDLSPAERARLQASIELHGRIAASLREIGLSGDAVRANLRAAVGRLEESLGQVADWVDGLEAWTGGINEFIETLEDREQNEEGERLAELTRLRKSIESLRDDVADKKDKLESLAELKDESFDDLEEAFAGSNGLLARISSAVNLVKETPQIVVGWKSQIEDIADGLGDLARQLGDDFRNAVLPDARKKLLDSLQADFPETTKLIEVVTALFDSKGLRNVLDLAESLPDADSLSNWISLEDPEDTYIELDRLGWAVRDRLMLIVRFRKDRQGALAPADEAERFVYFVEAAQMGWHRRVTSNLIFSRPEDSDTSRKWQPNVAALVNWQHRKRDPGKFGRFRNWLGFGAGIHLASLDQGDDSVEFGIGANVVLWRGLLSAGFGKNLSVEDDQEYYLLGIDLFDVLNRTRFNRESTQQTLSAVNED